MENRFKLRISRMFRSSFGSCRSRNISGVIENADFTSQNHKNFHLIEALSPKARPFSSICKPRCPETTGMIINHGCFDSLPRRKVSEQHSPFVVTARNGRMCPPASPISPDYFDYKDFEFKEKKDSLKNKKKKRTPVKRSSKMRDNMCVFSSSSRDSFKYGSWWFSSEDEREDETETLFSSKSLTSDSSPESLQKHRSRRSKRGTRRRRAAAKSNDQLGILPLSQGRVKDSFAVVKSSSDPYNDFRTSMVEMIVEKQLFAAKDLEQLLQCFLSLNSYRHHRIILEVFTEIWEALFSS